MAEKQTKKLDKVYVSRRKLKNGEFNWSVKVKEVEKNLMFDAKPDAIKYVKGNLDNSLVTVQDDTGKFAYSFKIIDSRTTDTRIFKVLAPEEHKNLRTIGVKIVDGSPNVEVEEKGASSLAIYSLFSLMLISSFAFLAITLYLKYLA